MKMTSQKQVEVMMSDPYGQVSYLRTLLSIFHFTPSEFILSDRHWGVSVFTSSIN